MITAVIQGLALLTLLSDIGIGILGILYLSKYIASDKLFNIIQKITSRHAYTFAFIVSLVATLGSLFFSEVAKLQPCILCWYQRILMYPQSIMLYTAIIRNERVLKPYLLVLSSIGAVIAAYHYFIQRMPSANILPCDAYLPVLCTKATFYFGYVSIPMMSLTAFVLIIILMLMSTPKLPKKTKSS